MRVHVADTSAFVPHQIFDGSILEIEPCPGWLFQLESEAEESGAHLILESYSGARNASDVLYTQRKRLLSAKAVLAWLPGETYPTLIRVEESAEVEENEQALNAFRLDSAKPIPLGKLKGRIFILGAVASVTRRFGSGGAGPRGNANL